jgi:hypothetical protein
MLVAVGSTKGSPGATTLALALAARWPGEAVLIEADPAGGDLGARCGVADHPGLSSLVLAARRGVPHLAEHTQRLGAGVDVVVAPASATRAAATVAALTVTSLSGSGMDVLVDVGRLSEHAPTRGLVAAADRLVVVCRGDLPGIDHTAAYTQSVPDGSRIGVVVMGASGYPMAELAQLFGVQVLVHAPIDHRGVAVLTGARRPDRGWHRVGLPAAARTVALDLRPQRPAVDSPAPVPDAHRSTRSPAPRDVEIVT